MAGDEDAAAGGGAAARALKAARRKLPQLVNGRGGAPRRKRQLFTHVALEMDKQTAKYMPYSELAFPRLAEGQDARGEDATRGQAQAEMASLWMVGGLDHEKRNETEGNLADLAHIINLPGGTLMPAAASKLREVYNKERKNLSSAEKRLKRMTASQRRRVLGGRAIAPRLSDAAVLRLRELEKTKGGVVTLGRKEHARRLRKIRRARPHATYGRENRKIRRAIADKAGPVVSNTMRSRTLEGLFQVERVNMQAALRIQGSYRRYRAKLQWKLIIKKSCAVRKIQKVVRGMLARTLIRVWLLRRSWLVIVSQACIRGYLTRLHVRERLVRERRSVVRMQRVIRGYLGRMRADMRRSELAALRVQRAWRGCTARARADRQWLSREVTKAQRVVRGHLSRQRYRHWKREAHEAACVLQRSFRAVVGRWTAYDMLWGRETERRRHLLQELRAEDEFWCDEAARLRNKLAPGGELDTALAAAREQSASTLDKVREKEFDFLAMLHERNILDRRAVMQGWTSEVDRFVDEHRSFVTNAKLEFLFVTAPFERQLEARVAEMQERLEDCEWHAAEVRRLRQDEVQELYARESKHRWELARRARRRAVAEQRRRWRVTWYTDDGKVDARCRAGYPPDPSILAGPERDTLCIGAVNLLAGTVDEDVSGLELITQQVALQNAQNQIVQHGAVLKPLFDGMESLTEEVSKLSLRVSVERAAKAAQLDQQLLLEDEDEDASSLRSSS